ncbi:unnamed protein product [Staurois parvus]|uniref:Uncharacterized protein n=1 Tax=Staurois parvus TaxID=386267 RepID=A0ABN9GB12_9NEOB|nr:unnamed protein product [Staurois parvus]
MHSPKKKKNLSGNTHQTEHVHVTVQFFSYQVIKDGYWKKGDHRRQDQTAFLHNNPLGSTVSITSMLYYIYTLISPFWV